MGSASAARVSPDQYHGPVLSTVPPLFFFSSFFLANKSMPEIIQNHQSFLGHTHAHQILRKCFQSSGKCHQQHVGNTVSRLSRNLFTSPPSQPVYFSALMHLLVFHLNNDYFFLFSPSSAPTSINHT